MKSAYLQSAPSANASSGGWRASCWTARFTRHFTFCGATPMPTDDHGRGALRIRAMRGEDRAIWLEMRVALWPEENRLAHNDMIDRMLADEVAWAFVAETAPGSSAAFAEVTLRKFANGCETQPVPFLEGI